jgi:hypothetical protein
MIYFGLFRIHSRSILSAFVAAEVLMRLSAE